jgi:hypothetical protein
MADYLTITETRLDAMATALHEMATELQDGELDAAIAAMDDKKRKITPPEEFYAVEFPNKIPPYETGDPNYEQ